jgi:UDP-N-acetylmuramoyl-tripeptide--D-alanyl-D-alanine ligase
MSHELWTSHDAAAATGGTTNARWVAHGISIDSRTVRKGDLFVALKGETYDGHDFVEAAFENGAAAAMVSREVHGGEALLLVEDTLQALRALGQAARKRTQARIIAVTGSVGKTGTKEALRHVLSAQGKTHASAASYNNDFGVPLSLARMPTDTEFGIFEIGMNSFGEIARQAVQVRPHVAIVTNIHPVHIEYLGSIEAIANEKADIFRALEPDGIAIYGRNVGAGGDKQLALKSAGRTRLIFSPYGDDRDDARLREVKADANGTAVTARILGQDYTYRIPVPGAHIAENSLAVLLAVHAAGGSVEKAARSYATLPQLQGRGQKSALTMPHGGTATLLDESYNASPASIRAALQVLGMNEGRRIAVLGDMRELGPESRTFHEGLAPDIESAKVDLVFLSGSNMKHLFDTLPKGLQGAWAPDSTSLLPMVRAALKDGDVVLVKGSLGSRMKVIVEGLTAPGEQPAHAL